MFKLLNCLISILDKLCFILSAGFSFVNLVLLKNLSAKQINCSSNDTGRISRCGTGRFRSSIMASESPVPVCLSQTKAWRGYPFSALNRLPDSHDRYNRPPHGNRYPERYTKKIPMSCNIAASSIKSQIQIHLRMQTGQCQCLIRHAAAMSHQNPVGIRTFRIIFLYYIKRFHPIYFLRDKNKQSLSHMDEFAEDIPHWPSNIYYVGDVSMYYLAKVSTTSHH